MDRVAKRREVPRHLRDRRAIGPPRVADEHPLADDQHVAAVYRPRRLDVHERTIRRQRLDDGGRLAAPRLGARMRNDGDLVEHDGDVLDEHRVRHLIAGREPHDRAADLLQRLLVGTVLAPRRLDIDRLAREMRQLAPHDGRAEIARESHPHGAPRQTPSTTSVSLVAATWRMLFGARYSTDSH